MSTCRAFDLALGVLALGLACARSTENPAAPEAAFAGGAATPISPPVPGASGCVESEELKAYVAALEARRARARDAEIAALGARREVRRGMFWESPSARIGEIYEADGRRFTIVAHYAPGFDPEVPIAKQGNLVLRLEERARAHAVPVLACGVVSCPRASSGERHSVRPVAIELEPGETSGGVLVVTYDYGWAQVTHAERERCP